ncbi:uncharacterized protein LOC143513864 [Brachyhypopomus gauderio]|uniref:uncharacterized protein LOC143513864 n=1 Tax=Brachyhypopomus gauderio TaxID=698409 RepID=UPI00404193E5
MMKHITEITVICLLLYGSLHIAQTDDSSSKESNENHDTVEDSNEDSREDGKIIICLVVFAGAGLILLAQLLWRCYFKGTAAKANRTEHIYANIDHSPAITQPASSRPNESKSKYVLAGDPKIVNLGKNK